MLTCSAVGVGVASQLDSRVGGCGLVGGQGWELGNVVAKDTHAPVAIRRH